MDPWWIIGPLIFGWWAVSMVGMTWAARPIHWRAAAKTAAPAVCWLILVIVLMFRALSMQVFI